MVGGLVKQQNVRLVWGRWCSSGHQILGSRHTAGRACLNASSANARRLFCPPDSTRIGFSAKSPDSPNRPRYFLACRSGKGVAFTPDNAPRVRQQPSPRLEAQR